MMTRKNLLIAAGVLIALLFLFPPKVIVATNPLAPGHDEVESAGYTFILSDPVKQKSGGVMESNELVHAHIKFIQWMLPILVVGGATVFMLRKLPN